MLTVKQVEENGYEQIHEVTRVWFETEAMQRRAQAIAQHGGDSPQPVPRDTLYAAVPGEDHPMQFGSGTIYVMNENGKTVSRYDLRGPMKQEPYPLCRFGRGDDAGEGSSYPTGRAHIAPA